MVAEPTPIRWTCNGLAFYIHSKSGIGEEIVAVMGQRGILNSEGMIKP